MKRIALTIAVLALLAAACSSDDTEVSGTVTDTAVESAIDATGTDDDTETADSEEASDAAASGGSGSFTVEVWVDNWMAVYVDGELIGEDSVSITTERSFNSETFSFDATYPFVLAIEAKDFKETDSGLEYIGESNQQMGDGGIIAQVKDSSGAVVAVTSSDWDSLVVHRAPLNTDCEGDDNPDDTCEYEITDTPADWTSTSFDTSAWSPATVWSANDVDPKQGYDDIDWDDSAELIWGTDLEVDNTVLLRTTVG